MFEEQAIQDDARIPRILSKVPGVWSLHDIVFEHTDVLSIAPEDEPIAMYVMTLCLLALFFVSFHPFSRSGIDSWYYSFCFDNIANAEASMAGGSNKSIKSSVCGLTLVELQKGITTLSWRTLKERGSWLKVRFCLQIAFTSVSNLLAYSQGSGYRA